MQRLTRLSTLLHVGIEDIDLLVNTFITAEDQNYTLFNYVNEVNQEIEKLEDQITAIKREIDRYKSGGQELDRNKSAAVSWKDAVI